MQAPIDIKQAEKLRIDDLKFNYQPADLDVINDCNRYRILVKFPDNYWLTVGKKPYFLTELHFRVPGENAVHGKRPRMSVQFVHFSPQGVFLIIEVPVIPGKENAVIKTLWEHIPEPGKESKVRWSEDQPDGPAARRSQLLSISGIADNPYLQRGGAVVRNAEPDRNVRSADRGVHEALQQHGPAAAAAQRSPSQRARVKYFLRCLPACVGRLESPGRWRRR